MAGSALPKSLRFFCCVLPTQNQRTADLGFTNFQLDELNANAEVPPSGVPCKIVDLHRILLQSYPARDPMRALRHGLAPALPRPNVVVSMPRGTFSTTAGCRRICTNGHRPLLAPALNAHALGFIVSACYCRRPPPAPQYSRFCSSCFGACTESHAAPAGRILNWKLRACNAAILGTRGTSRLCTRSTYGNFCSAPCCCAFVEQVRGADITLPYQEVCGP